MLQFSSMAFLAINTASFTESLVLFSGKKILAEKTWKGKSDESQKLLANISKLLDLSHLKFKDIKGILVIKGPGPFSAVRIGVTVANTLAFALNIPIYSINTTTFWLMRKPHKDGILLLHAGGNFVYRYGFGLKDGVSEIKKALEIPVNSPRIFYGDITEKEALEFKAIKKTNWKFIPESSLDSFGKTIINVKLARLKKGKVITPEYWKPPNITHSKS